MEKRYKKLKRRQTKRKKVLEKRLRQRWLERFACSLADMAEMVGSKVKKHRSNAKTRFIARAIQAELGLVNASEETPDYAIPPILKLRKNLFLTFASWTYLMFEEIKKLKERGKLRSVVELFDETYDSNKKKKKHRSRRRGKEDGSLGDSSEHSVSKEVINKMYEDWNSPYNMSARAKKDVLLELANEPFWDLSQKTENHHYCNFAVYQWVDYYRVIDLNRTYPDSEYYREDFQHITGSFCSSHSHGGFNPKFRKGLEIDEVP
uniref:(California timema) hypothetical protein n=1 Tax=Timema californicum TaxID=61474 RepID=A0A7R9P7Q3_TIMCA|nr:unnamed protein product [Timema californicum]